jgi:hypothetical protein
MVNLDIEEISKEGELLIRSCRVKINGNTVITPTKTIGVTLSDSFNIKESERFIGNKFKPFGEVYASISLNKLADTMLDAKKVKTLNLQLLNKVNALKQAGALPYILLSITEENGSPINHLLSQDAQRFIFDLLWGTQGNSIIVTPLLGILPSPKDYSIMIDAFRQRQKDAIDRKNQPLMAIIPPSYSHVDPKLVEKYWKCGVRIFGYNCENTKYGAYGSIIEGLHYELSRLSKESGENYIINAINSKFRYGKSKTSRIHSLIGAGYGFDAYSPNHIRSKFNPPVKPKKYIFSDIDYGFLDVAELKDIRDIDDIVNTNALKTQDLAEIPQLSVYKQTKICKSHDIEKTIKEIETYSAYIETNELFEYLSSKEKIKNERTEIEKFKPHKKEVDEWSK